MDNGSSMANRKSKYTVKRFGDQRRIELYEKSVFECEYAAYWWTSDGSGGEHVCECVSAV